MIKDSKIAIIGGGKVARHFSHYFKLLQIPYELWTRSKDPNYLRLPELIKTKDSILILINDSAIESFILEHHKILQGKTLIHFSGQLVTPFAYGAHPLMTFSQEYYDLATYQKIPFILNRGSPSLKELLPGLNNPYFFINQEQRAFYHSLCVMSGNFTILLWQKFFHDLKEKLQLPEEVIYPYLNQIFINLNTSPHDALTGPLQRGDKKTITANLNALSNDPYQKIYQAFVELYNPSELEEKISEC